MDVEFLKALGVLLEKTEYLNDCRGWQSDKMTAAWWTVAQWHKEQIAVRDISGRIVADAQPEPQPRPDGPHASNADARRPVQE